MIRYMIKELFLFKLVNSSSIRLSLGAQLYYLYYCFKQCCFFFCIFAHATLECRILPISTPFNSWQSISCSKPFAGLWCLASLYAVQKTRAVLAICSDWLLTIVSTMMSSFAYQEFLLLLNEPWSGHVKNFILFFLSARSCFLMSEADEVTVHVTHSFDSFIPLCLFWP